ncbi:MAG: hypothetical protein HN948_06205 [Clostridia bacterium]|jgi:hypothetical protein|nr:hypothetical protein [Clostridia bacterium]MBT7122589.1 hypothetical protein [Clostridia bacterium]
MNSRILELADTIRELDVSSKNAERKKKWIAHNNLQSDGEILINVHFWKNVINPLWRELVPDSEIVSKTEDEIFLERTLLQRIYKFTKIDDDDVMQPTVWVNPVMSEKSSMFGVDELAAHDGVSIKYTSVIQNIEDVSKFKQPVFDIDEQKTETKIQHMRELVGDKIPIKVKMPMLHANPFEFAAKFRSMDDLYLDFIDNPELVHALMDTFTKMIIRRFTELDGIGYDPEQTWDFRIHHDRIEDETKRNTLKNCWVYVSDQSACVISPDMFSEFIIAYHKRITKLFGKVYFHGCEDLTQKAQYIKELPNLRRFHISPWSDIGKITAELGSGFVYEAHVHPANHLFAYSHEQIASDIKRICGQYKSNNATFDLNLSDLETINNEPQKLIDWAKIAREAISGLH